MIPATRSGNKSAQCSLLIAISGQRCPDGTPGGVQAALHRAFWDLEDAGDFWKGQTGAEDETEDFSVPWTKPGHGGGDVRHLDAIEREQLGTGRRVGMFWEDIVMRG